MKLSLFVPIYNEEDIVKDSVLAFEKAVSGISDDYEICVVNDGSTDRSSDRVNEISRINPRVILMEYASGPTRRENLAASFLKARGDIIIFLDVDLVDSLGYLPGLIQAIDDNDIVIGSRYLAGSVVKRKLWRLITSSIFNFGIRVLFKCRIRDYVCGFKAFRKEAIKELIKEMGPDPTYRRGIFWDAEMLLRAGWKGLRIKEVPISWYERKKSALSVRSEIKTLGYVFRFCLRSPALRSP